MIKGKSEMDLEEALFKKINFLIHVVHQKVLSFLPWVQIVYSGQSLPFFANGVFGHTHCFFFLHTKPHCTISYKRVQVQHNYHCQKVQRNYQKQSTRISGNKIPITLGHGFYYNKIKMIIFMIMYGSDWSVISIRWWAIRSSF